MSASNPIPIRADHDRGMNGDGVMTPARRSAHCLAEPRGALLPPVAELVGTGVFLFVAVSGSA